MYEKIDLHDQIDKLSTDVFKYSPKFLGLLKSLVTPLSDLQDDISDIVSNLLDIDYAKDYHLDWIGMLLNQPRFLIDFNDEKYFGMLGSHNSDTFGTLSDPNVGGYWYSYSYTNTATSKRLNDEQYRRVLKARIIYRNTNCSRGDILKVCNLLANNNNTVIELYEHKHLRIKYTDNDGILSYFVSRIDSDDNIIPLASGVFLEDYN